MMVLISSTIPGLQVLGYFVVFLREVYGICLSSGRCSVQAYSCGSPTEALSRVEVGTRLGGKPPRASATRLVW